MIGYFEGIDSERGIAWRCADSFSLRDFLRLSADASACATATNDRALVAVRVNPTKRVLLSTSGLVGGALRGLVLASGVAAAVATMAAPADAFTCGNSATGTGFPPGDAGGATDNGNGNATACGPARQRRWLGSRRLRLE
jgi:hypothetical protein